MNGVLSSGNALIISGWRTSTRARSGRSQTFKLLDAQTGEIVANFADNEMKQWKKMGKFVIRADYGREWELMVL
jgi:hypothetical protein